MSSVADEEDGVDRERLDDARRPPRAADEQTDGGDHHEHDGQPAQTGSPGSGLVECAT